MVIDVLVMRPSKSAFTLALVGTFAVACTACRERPPPIASFTLLPLGNVPELDRSVIAGLSHRFPGVTFTAAPVQPFPDKVLVKDGLQALDVDILETIAPRGAGTVALLARDLTGARTNFVFGQADLRRGLAVVSVARFRTVQGDPAEMTDQPRDQVLERSRRRLEMQLSSSVAKLLGLGPRCDDRRCVLHYPDNLAEFDAKGSNFCPEHAEELRKLLAARR